MTQLTKKVRKYRKKPENEPIQSANLKANNTAKLVKDLSNKIWEQPNFSLQEFLTIVKIGDQTFRAWRQKGVTNPRDAALNEIRRYLRIREDIFIAYFHEKISLEELWENRNTDMGVAVEKNKYISDYRLFETEDQLEILEKIASILREDFENTLTKIEDNLEPEEPTIELNQDQITRLKKLLDFSLKFNKKTEGSLIKEGVDGVLLENLKKNTSGSYPETEIKNLLPHLLPPAGWVDDTPVLSIGTSFGNDIDELVNCLS